MALPIASCGAIPDSAALHPGCRPCPDGSSTPRRGRGSPSGGGVIKPEQIIAPALLKLEVQGYELQALRGCEALLDRFQYVYCECSFVELYAGQALADAVISWLRERGLRLISVYNMANEEDGRAVQADFLFGR
ncbi:FkbM family methyltransferase [Metallibacterium sp.]